MLWYSNGKLLRFDTICEGVKVAKVGRQQYRLVLDKTADGQRRRATIIDIAGEIGEIGQIGQIGLTVPFTYRYRHTPLDQWRGTRPSIGRARRN